MLKEIIPRGDDALLYHVGLSNIWTSLDLTTDRGKLLLGQSMLPIGKLLDELVNTTTEVCDIVIQPQEGLNGDNGEIEQYSGITLIHPDDSFHWTGSENVKRSLAAVMIWRGRPPWNPPVKFKVIQRSFKRKNGEPGRAYHLEPVLDDKSSTK